MFNVGDILTAIDVHSNDIRNNVKAYNCRVDCITNTLGQKRFHITVYINRTGDRYRTIVARTDGRAFDEQYHFKLSDTFTEGELVDIYKVNNYDKVVYTARILEIPTSCNGVYILNVKDVVDHPVVRFNVKFAAKDRRDLPTGEFIFRKRK